MADNIEEEGVRQKLESFNVDVPTETTIKTKLTASSSFTNDDNDYATAVPVVGAADDGYDDHDMLINNLKWVEEGHDPSKLSDDVICTVLIKCDEETIKSLIEKRLDLNKLNDSNIQILLRDCNLMRLEFLLEQGLGVNMIPDYVQRMLIRIYRRTTFKLKRSCFLQDSGIDLTADTDIAGAEQDRQQAVNKDLFKNSLKSLIVKKAAALYIATAVDRTDIVQSLVKLAGKDIIRPCLQRTPISHDMEQIFMLELADRLRQKHVELKPTIVPGHQRDGNGTRSRVFIVYSVSIVQAEDYDFNGVGLVMLQNPYVISRLNNFASVSEKDLSDQGVERLPEEDAELSNEDAKRVKEAIKTHRDNLWLRHSNLNIITVRQVKRKTNGCDIQEACVILYCSTKGVIPLGEDEFPRTLSIQNDRHIKVVVREGFFDFGVYRSVPSTWPHSTLKMGCEMGRLTPQFDASGNPVCNSSGTLGPFVRYNNNLGFLTCSHVLFDIPTPSHTIDYTAVDSSLIDVVQPSSDATPFVSSTPCGVLERALFDPTRPISIDAAVVKLTDQSRVPSAGQFSNERHSSYKSAGFDELPEYNSGAILTSAQVNHMPCKPNVVKFGSRTDVTRGALSVFGADVRAFSTTLGLPNNAGGAMMKNQYLVIGIHPSTNFFDGGDSGSGVFFQDNNGQLLCVGMAIGHGVLENYPYKVGVVTPIDAILQALGPNISLATFP